MWQPTHVKVTVKQAKGLLTKGKNGTNDVFVVIGIGKEKYQTSIKEKAPPNVEWKEECELAIPSQGNKAIVQLTLYHHNSLGLDEFLGQVPLPMSDFDVYEKPKYRSYKLKGKADKDKKKGEKDRGELEVMVHFTVKSGSFLDISKKEKHKSSLTSLKHIGGSLMSIGGKERQSLKGFARSVSSKMDKIAKPRKKKSKTKTDESVLSNNLMTSQQTYGEADPGVISDDDDDFRFDDDVKVYNHSSSPQSTMSRGSSLMQDQTLDPDFDGESDEGLSFGLSPPRIVDDSKEKISPTKNSSGAEKVSSFSDLKSVLSGLTPTDSTIQEESSLELNEQSAKKEKVIQSPEKSVQHHEKSVQHQEKFVQHHEKSVQPPPIEDFVKDDEDSAICIDPPQTCSNASSSISLSNSSPIPSKDVVKIAPSQRVLSKSSSAVTLRHDSAGNQKGKRVVSATESLAFDSTGVTRSGSLSEKSSSQPIIMNEWERKLYGRTGITGSTENMSLNGSRTSLNSRTSSTGPHEIRRDDSFTRLPEVKALTLERKDETETRKQKRIKGISAFKHKFMSSKNGESKERLNEESRIVEGGNDRVPSPPTRSSKLPQEIHDKFAGKSREDLLETILSLQSSLEKEAKHTHDLEDYIDNLLLRVMDINPNILQAPTKKNRTMRFRANDLFTERHFL